jgi:hypothetical protein
LSFNFFKVLALVAMLGSSPGWGLHCAWEVQDFAANFSPDVSGRLTRSLREVYVRGWFSNKRDKGMTLPQFEGFLNSVARTMLGMSEAPIKTVRDGFLRYTAEADSGFLGDAFDQGLEEILIARQGDRYPQAQKTIQKSPEVWMGTHLTKAAQERMLKYLDSHPQWANIPFVSLMNDHSVGFRPFLERDQTALAILSWAGELRGNGARADRVRIRSPLIHMAGGYFNDCFLKTINDAVVSVLSAPRSGETLNEGVEIYIHADVTYVGKDLFMYDALRSRSTLVELLIEEADRADRFELRGELSSLDIKQLRNRYYELLAAELAGSLGNRLPAEQAEAIPRIQSQFGPTLRFTSRRDPRPVTVRFIKP